MSIQSPSLIPNPDEVGLTPVLDRDPYLTELLNQFQAVPEVAWVKEIRDRAADAVRSCNQIQSY